jgi:hypothetical protein
MNLIEAIKTNKPFHRKDSDYIHYWHLFYNNPLTKLAISMEELLADDYVVYEVKKSEIPDNVIPFRRRNKFDPPPNPGNKGA